MKYPIKYTKEAIEDIGRIYDEVYNACLDHNVTKKYLNELIDKIVLISDFPNSGSPLCYGKFISDYRYIVYKSYLAFYYISNEAIFIDRILFAKSDYIKKLRLWTA